MISNPPILGRMTQPTNNPNQTKKEVSVFKKHHELVVMKPLPGVTITRQVRQIYLSLLSIGQTQAQAKKGGMLATDKFRAPLAVILGNVGMGETQYQNAKNYITEMRDWLVTWDSANAKGPTFDLGLQDGDTLVNKSFYMLVEPTWIKDSRRRLYLEWTFPPHIHKRLVIEDPQRDHFALINLAVVASLGSHVALALYEICVKFKYRDKPQGDTARKPSEWWVDALSGHIPEDEKKRRPWVKFKSEKIMPAIADINLNSDIEVQVHDDKKSGEVFFSVMKKQKTFETFPMFSHEAGKALDDQLLSRATKLLQASEKRIERLIGKFGEKPFRATLDLLEERLKLVHAEPVPFPFAWAEKVLSRGQSIAPLLETESSQVKRLPEVGEGETEIIFSRELNTPQPKPVIHEREVSLVKNMLVEINTLSKSERSRLIEAAKDKLQSAGFAIRPAELKRITGLKITSQGLIGSKVINIYAEERYGPKWRDQVDALPL